MFWINNLPQPLTGWYGNQDTVTIPASFIS